MRVQENFAAYGLQYGQLVLVCVLIGGYRIPLTPSFQNLTVLLTLLVSYVAWAFILKRQDVLDQLPNIGFIDSQDKKKIILLLCKSPVQPSQHSPRALHRRLADFKFRRHRLPPRNAARHPLEDRLYAARPSNRTGVRKGPRPKRVPGQLTYTIQFSLCTALYFIRSSCAAP